MSYLPVTLLAFFLNGVAVTIDKLLLTKKLPDPLVYVFYVSGFSLLALALLPFTHPPSSDVFLLSQASTLFWTVGAYLMFTALKFGSLTRVIPAIGTLTPLILLMMALYKNALTTNQIWAVGFLLLGLIFITLEDLKGRLNSKELTLEMASATFFALSYILLREAYLRSEFLTVLVYSRLILIPLGLTILVIPLLRKRILTNSGFKTSLLTNVGIIFFIGQALGGAAQILLTYSISLANPALVNSLQGSQYVFLFIFGLILSSKFPHVFKKERSFLLAKIAAILVIALGLYMLAHSEAVTQTKIGVTFSPRYAQSLGLDPMDTYLKILDDLQVKTVRLPIYWDEVETFPNQLSFTKLDFYLSEALKRQVEVILVLGYKQPRWPECFPPPWVSKLIRRMREEKILRLIENEVNYFKKFPHILAWQVENEPLFQYGLCEKVDAKTAELLKKEIAIVKSLDPRPIIITDSGELGLWAPATASSDWLGISLYRQVWSSYLGIQDYPLPPFFYTLKAQVARSLTGRTGSNIISELQAEPWMGNRQSISEANIEEQIKILPVDKLKNNVLYAKEVGFDLTLVWGVEWWYFMDKNGHSEYLEYARGLFSVGKQSSSEVRGLFSVGKQSSSEVRGLFR